MVGRISKNTPPRSEAETHVDFLHRFTAHYRRRDHRLMLQELKQFEKSGIAGLSPIGLSYFYTAQQAADNKDAEAAFRCAVRALELATETNDRLRTLNLLADLAGPFAQLPQDRQQSAKSMLGKYLEKNKLELHPLAEIRFWTIILKIYFHYRQLDLVLRLGDRIFREETSPEMKGHIALDWLLSARRLTRVKGSTQPPAAVREKAEFVLCVTPQVITDRRRADEEVFHNFIINLEYFGLYDLQAEAVRLRQPDADDPVREYLRISELGRRDLAAAVSSVHRFKIPDGSSPKQSVTLMQEFQILYVRLIRQYLEGQRVELAAVPVPPLAGRITQQMAQTPRHQQPELSRLIKRVRAATFLPFLSMARESAYCYVALTMLPKEKRAEGSEMADAHLLFEPTRGAVELFLPAPQTAGFVKLSYQLQRNEHGALTGISDHAFFTGVPREKQGEVPFFWEQYELQALLNGEFIGEEAQRAVADYRSRLEETNHKMVVALQREAYEALRQAFMRRSEYQRLQVELENRLNLALKIGERFPPAITTGTYELTESDLLKPLCQAVEIRVSDKGSLAIVHRQGEDGLYFGLTDWRTIIGLDQGELKDKLLNRYLYELILTAMIKLAHGRGRKSSGEAAATGYLLERGEIPGQKAATTADLDRIFRREFYEQLRTKGLISAPWFTRELTEAGEELYRPLADQSAAGKKQALTKLGNDAVFVQTEADGNLMRLRVGLVRASKDGVGPWKRNPVREAQQALLGDSRRLPEYQGLYVLTAFSNGIKHLKLYALREEAEELTEQIDRLEAEIAGGSFRDLGQLLDGTAKATRVKIEAAVQAGTAAIASQTAELFGPIQTTYRRPAMTRLSALLADGFMLELAHSVD